MDVWFPDEAIQGHSEQHIAPPSYYVCEKNKQFWEMFFILGKKSLWGYFWTLCVTLTLNNGMCFLHARVKMSHIRQWIRDSKRGKYTEFLFLKLKTWCWLLKEGSRSCTRHMYHFVRKPIHIATAFCVAMSETRTRSQRPLYFPLQITL